jgi:hypothetical protein
MCDIVVTMSEPSKTKTPSVPSKPSEENQPPKPKVDKKRAEQVERDAGRGGDSHAVEGDRPQK